MGTIRKTKNGVKVTMSVEELLTQKTYLKLPNEERLWVNYLGNLVSRAASYILHSKAPQYSKTYKQIRVSGTGKVVVEFSDEEIGES